MWKKQNITLSSVMCDATGARLVPKAGWPVRMRDVGHKESTFLNLHLACKRSKGFRA